MEKVILIDESLTFTKIGVVYEHQLDQVYLQNNFEKDLQNTVIQGQITDVVKNLQAVFVDFGQEKNGLLHFKQIPEYYKTRIKEGQRLPIQVIRENMGSKGHKLTSFINIPGKHLVCLPFEEGISISKKIKNIEVRHSIKEWITTNTPKNYGFIARTSSQFISKEELLDELSSLIKETDNFMSKKDSLSKGSVLIKDKHLAIKIILENKIEGEKLKVICNSPWLMETIKNDLSGYNSEMIEYVLLNSLEDTFKYYDVEKVFNETLRKKIWLKNGGNLVIEPTEALTVIDVNSAKAVITKNANKAVLNLNKLAIEESIRQIRKRNLSGMLVIDLVDLRKSGDKEEIYKFAVECITRIDGKRSIIYPITELGLLQIVRTKQYMSIYQSVLAECPSCMSVGGRYKASYETYLIEAHIRRTLLHTTNKKIFIKCKSFIYDYIFNNNLLNLLQKYYNIELELTRETEKETNSFSISYHI